MSLPNGFENSREYFREVNDFLIEYAWIYKEANTEFVKADILNQMPQAFQHYFIEIETNDLNKFPYVHEPLHNLHAKALIEFRQKLAKLIPLEAYKEPTNVESSIKLENLKKINIKKQHEIQRLATVVGESLKTKQNLIENEKQQKYVLIDFGSGLGYLSQLLYKLNKEILILGLEADTNRVQAADKRKITYMPAAINAIQYRQHFITENSKDFIMQTVQEVFKLYYQHIPEQPNTKMAIIGLHACADLTITSMKLFFQLPHVQHLIIMPCCYHKLQVCADAASATASAATAAAAAANTCRVNFKFKNFPISESLKQVLADNKDNNNHNDNINYAITNETFTTYLNRPFLRLACQQTLKRWRKFTSQQHQAHGCEMFLRAVAESLKLEEEEMELVIVKRKEEKNNFNSFSNEKLKNFDNFKRFYALKTKTTNELVEWSEWHRKKFFKILVKYPDGSKLAEGLTCLQTSMQKLCENLVLYDRLCFMEETAFKMNLKINLRYEKIMDEELSPRCYALIAEKL